MFALCAMHVTALDVDPAREFANIFKANARYVWRVLRHLGVSPPDIEDVSQEVFVVVHRRHGEFEQRSTIRTWIYGICVRKASEYRRRAWRRRETSTDAVPEASSLREGQDAQVDARLKLQRLSLLLDGLKAEHRAAFVLFELEGLSMQEVAEALNCAAPTAYAWHRQAKATMKAKLQREAAHHG